MRPAVVKGKQLIGKTSPLLKIELELESNIQPFSTMRLLMMMRLPTPMPPLNSAS
jgi:hypothetical protein